MPRIPENDAAAIVRSFEAMDETQRAQALDILAQYRDQQSDLGEPQWPTQDKAAQDYTNRLRGMFKDIKTVDSVAPSLTAILPYSQNPDADRARVANTAYMAQRYGKTPEEISAAYDLYRNDYAQRFLQAPTGLDDLGFHKAAAQEIQKAELKEGAELDGIKAAFRGDDVIPALQAWQAKNTDRLPDSTEFTRGFLKARETSGDHLEFAEKLLKQIESNTGLTKGEGEQRPKAASRESAADFEQSLAALADMKPKDRKQVYAIIGAKAEAAGYDPKGFWAQMLSEFGKGMARAGDTVSTSGADLLAGGSMVGGDAAGGFAPVPADSQERFQQGMEARGKRGVIFAEIENLVAGTVDPVKPVLGWMNDTVERGLIKGPGAVAPFMAASVALGPYGAGVLFTADFAEQNRRDLVISGMDEGQARVIGMAAAPLQAITESLSNALQLGRFPAVQKVLAGFTKPIGGGAGLITRYVQNSAISLGTEFTEEQLQDNFIVPATQELLGALQVDVPEVDWSMYRNRAIESTPELLSVLAPMALVFGGTMTAAQANLSAVAISSQDMLEAAGFSSAQANTIRSETAPEAQIAKARELWGQRAGTAKSIEDAAKSVGERMKQLQTDHMAAQLDMERRGILPRMLRSSEDNWRLTFSDGSTADFHTHQDADAARWQWATDQLGKVHLATREALAQMEKNAAVGREFAVEFKPDAMTAKQAVEEGRATPAQIDRRIAQGEAAGEVGEEETFSNAASIDKATSDYLSSLQILGSSANEFKDGVLRTTIRLYEGAHVLTLVEEKLEGDAKQILASKPGSEWMLRSLRNYEQISGDSILRKVPDSELTQDDLIEAWSSLGQSYLVGKSKKGAAIGKGGARRIFADVLKAGMGGAMNSETQFFNAVWRRAAKLSKLKREGKLGEDLTAELERQLGIDSQAAHEAAVADGVAAAMSYSEENPGPNGETFSMGYLGNVQDSGNVQLKAVDLARGTHESEGLDQGSEGQGTFRYRKDNKTLYWHLPPGELRKESAIAALERKGFKVDRSIVMTFGSEHSYLAHGLAREVATTFSLSRATPADASNVVQMPDGARLVGPTTFSIRAFHGTPHKVDRFSLDKIGTGEGAQAYGWGLYFAESREVGEGYRDKLAQWTLLTSDGKIYDDRKELKNLNVRAVLNKNGSIEEAIARAKSVIESIPGTQGAELALADISTLEELKGRGGLTKTKGNLYTVELLPDADEFLDWDKPLSEQSEKVRKAVGPLIHSRDTVKEREAAFAEYDAGAIPKLELSKRLEEIPTRSIQQSDTGATIYQRLWSSQTANGREASEFLASIGIPGIRYLDGQSRDGGSGTSNFVIFDESLVKILEENGKPVGETFSLRKFPVPPGLAEAAQKARGESSLILAYQAAQRGSSSAMVPIRSVYEQAKKYQPALTPAQFMAEVNALNDSGKILVGLSETMKAVEAAGEFRVGGAGTEMAFAPQETFSVRVTPAQDAEYAKAVADGDVAKQQAMVDAAAKAAGYDSPVVYHGTLATFSEFSKDKLGSYTGAQSAKKGFFFASSKDNAEYYTKDVWASILKADPDVVAANAEYESKKSEAEKASEAQYRSQFDPSLSTSERQSFISEMNRAKSAQSAAAGKISTTMERRRKEMSKVLPFYLKVENMAEVDFKNAPWRPETFSSAIDRAQSNGNDGIHIKNTKDPLPTDVFVVFDPNQIKSADPVTRDESGNVIPLSQRFNPARDEITYSLRSGDFSSRMAAAFSPFQRSPELRRLMGKLAHERVMRLAADKVANFGPGKQFTTTGLQSLLESPGWIENRTDELMEQWLEGLTPAARQAYEAGLQSIEDHPLIKEMRGQGLRIMRRATALKQGLNIVDGKETGDYNGMPNLPASLMAKSGFGALPDKIAQAIHDASPGLMPDGHADTLWDALSSVIRDVEDRNATFQDINTKFKAAKKEAMVKAKAEAPASPAYNAEQRKKMKETIRVLDAILSAVPPDVRPRVGGYARVPELDTDAKTMNFIENRIAKLDVELSKYLKKEYAENIKKVLKKNRSTRGKRGQMEGRTVANVTEQIDYAANFSELSKVEQDKEIAHLESIIADDKSTADQIDAAVSRLGIAELFYDFENQDAGALGTISDWLDDLVSSGRDVKKALDEDRREYLTNLKTSGITSILGVPNASQTDAENVAEKIKGSILRQAIEKVKGFINSVLPTTAQQFEDVFGVGSEVGSEFIPRIWDAANQATDIKRAIEASRREMLAKVFKTKSTIKQVSAMAKLQQSKKSGVFILEGRKTESVTVPLEILQRLADGAISAKDAGLTVAESKAALEQWAESSARTRNATIERETFPGTLKEIEMSEMQALNYWLHWNQEAVRARMESHGWTEESIKQLRAFMSEETVEIGRWMSDTYATAGRALVDPVYRRLYHAPLPYVKNFAPTFYATGGNDSTLAIDQAQNSSGIMASFTKGRRPHNHNVRRVDAMTAFLSHFEHVSHWVSYVELLRDMKAVISSEDVQHAIIAQFGPSAASALTKRVKSIETQGNNQAWSLHEIDGMFARLNQALAFKGLSWRISPVVKQTSAVLNPLLADVPAHAYAIGLSKLFAGKLDVSGMWKSGSIQRRIEGGFSAEARIAMQATGGGPVGAVAIQVMSKGMLPMQWTDAGWNAVGAAIAYDYYRGLAIKAGENAEMAEHTAARAVDGMLATAAQPADLVNRSLIEGSPNPFVKAAWMFASESRKTLAIEYYAGKRLLTGKSKNKAMDVQRVVVAHVVMGAVTQLMSGLLASAFGGDDDEEREWSVGQWAAAILAGPINGLFVVGDGLNYLLRMALGVRAFRNLPGYVQLAADAGTAASHIDDLFDGDSEEMMKEINRLSGSIGFVASGFFGPAAQAADVILGNPLRDLAKALGD